MRNKQASSKFRISLALVLAVAVVFGFAAGVVGELWVNNFLMSELQIKSFADLTSRIDELTAQKNKDFKELLSEQDFSINKIVEKVQPTVVNFYLYKKPGSSLSNLYLDSESLGSGFVLTADGWLITSKQVITDPRREYTVQVGQEILAVTEIVDDPITDAVFVKIEKDNLAVAEFGTKNTLNFGQSVLVATGREGVKRATLDDLYFAQVEQLTDFIHSSESFYRYILLSNEFSDKSLGSPVITLDGKVIGILVSQRGEVLPIDYFSNIIKSAVQTGKVLRSYLGVNYLDLQLAPNYQSDYVAGAVLKSDGRQPAVISSGPAGQAGLVADDLIIKVENEEVNKTHTLSQLIQDYQPGVEINLTIIRQGKEMAVKVKLEEL